MARARNKPMTATMLKERKAKKAAKKAVRQKSASQALLKSGQRAGKSVLAGYKKRKKK